MSFSPFITDSYRSKLYGYGKNPQTLQTYKRFGRLHGNRGLAKVLGVQKGWKASLLAHSVKDAWTQTASGALLFTPMFAYSAAKAQRGEELAAFSSEMIGWYTHGMLATTITAALHVVPGFGLLKPGMRALAGMLIATVPNDHITDRLGYLFRRLGSAGRRQYQLEMGAGYQDSDAQGAARIAALQEMSGSMVPSRRLLGQEARFLHR